MLPKTVLSFPVTHYSGALHTRTSYLITIFSSSYSASPLLPSQKREGLKSLKISSYSTRFPPFLLPTVLLKSSQLTKKKTFPRMLMRAKPYECFVLKKKQSFFIKQIELFANLLLTVFKERSSNSCCFVIRNNLPKNIRSTYYKIKMIKRLV